MRILIVLFLFVSLARAAPAQSLSGPVEGFIYDASTHSLRAVDGLPGSATFGPVILSDVGFGSVAPSKNYAIAFQGGHGLFVSGLGSAHVSTSPIPDVFGQPEGAVWSSDGSVAVLYSRSGKWIQELTGLPKTPRANPNLNLTALDGSLSAVAVNADGKQIAIGTRGAQGQVYLNESNQNLIPLAKIDDPISLSFSENGANLYALDGVALKLAVVTISNWSSQVLPLPELRDPLAILAGHDAANQPVVFVASGKDRLVGVYNPASQKMETTVRLGFLPTGLQDLGRNSFVIGSRMKSEDPLWLFTTAPRPAVYFVPAAAAPKGDE
jgi:hypothetical protein